MSGSDCKSSPTLRAILNADGETSIRVPTGNFSKREEDAPRRFDTGEGADDNIRRNRLDESSTPESPWGAALGDAGAPTK